MEFYRLLYNSEYSKKNGKYGIVDITTSIDPYLIEDGQPFPIDLFNGIDFIWEGTLNKEFADFQMSYFPWRLISDRMYNILKKYSSQESIYYHPIKIYSSQYGYRDYFLMHFLRKSDVIDKKRTGDSLLNPVIDVHKAIGLDVFIYKEYDPSVFCISETVKSDLELAEITGCSYQSIS